MDLSGAGLLVFTYGILLLIQTTSSYEDFSTSVRSPLEYSDTATLLIIAVSSPTILQGRNRVVDLQL
jgi:hypothetical protein